MSSNEGNDNDDEAGLSDRDNQLLEMETLPLPTSSQGMETEEQWTLGSGVFEGKFIANVCAQAVLFKSKDAGWNGKTVVIMWDKVHMKNMNKGVFQEMTLGLIYKWTVMTEVTNYVREQGRVSRSRENFLMSARSSGATRQHRKSDYGT